jgi:hypothetical protein
MVGGVRAAIAARIKSELYLDLMTVINSETVDLVHNTKSGDRADRDALGSARSPIDQRRDRERIRQEISFGRKHDAIYRECAQPTEAAALEARRHPLVN